MIDRHAPSIRGRLAATRRRIARRLGAPSLLLGLLAVALILSSAGAGEAVGGWSPGTAAAPQLLLTEPREREVQTARGVARSSETTLRPIDPLTLANIPGYSPIAVGERWWHALSPTGTTLALIVDDGVPDASRPGTIRHSRLQLLDLIAWRVEPTPIVVTGEICWLGFAPDGLALYWLSFGGGEEIPAQERAYTLSRYRFGDPASTVLTTLPPGFIEERFDEASRQSRSGRELIVYRVAPGQNSPQLDYLDLASGQIVATLPLAAIRATPPDTIARDGGNAEVFVPGLAWDFPRDRLYLAHADNAQISVVDLRGRTIVRQEPFGDNAPGPTVAEQAYDTGRPPPAGRERYRFLALDSTGEHLIVSSRAVTATPLQGGRWRVQYRDEAMRLLDARTFRVRGELPPRSMLIAATGDGVLTQSVYYLTSGASVAPGDFRLHLREADTLREVWEEDTAPGDIWRIALSPGARFVYMARPNADRFFRGEGPVASFSQGNTLGVFDLRTRQLLGERRVSGDGLVPLWRTP